MYQMLLYNIYSKRKTDFIMEIRMALDGVWRATNAIKLQRHTLKVTSLYCCQFLYIVTMDLQACTWRNYMISQSG